MTRRRKQSFFPRLPDAPTPVSACIVRRVNFSDVDPMGVVFYGRYPYFFEQGAADLGRHCGLSYKDFMAANLRAPIVQLYIDYVAPLRLDEEFTIKTTLVWDEGTRLNTEFTLIRADGTIAATGYTVQLLTDAGNGEVLLISPPLYERCRKRWKGGEFACLQ